MLAPAESCVHIYTYARTYGTKYSYMKRKVSDAFENKKWQMEPVSNRIPEIGDLFLFSFSTVVLRRFSTQPKIYTIMRIADICSNF